MAAMTAISRLRKRIRTSRKIEPGHQRPGQDAGQAPGERVVPGVDRRQRPAGRRDEDRLPVAARVVAVRVERPGRGAEWQASIGKDRVAVGLDHVDRVARAIRGAAQDVDHPGRLVEDHPSDVAGHRDGRVEVRPRLAVRLAELDQPEAIVAEGDVQRRLVDAGDLGHAAGRGVEPDAGDDVGGRRRDERHASRLGDRDQWQRGQRESLQPAIGDRRLDRVALVGAKPGRIDDLARVAGRWALSRRS